MHEYKVLTAVIKYVNKKIHLDSRLKWVYVITALMKMGFVYCIELYID